MVRILSELAEVSLTSLAMAVSPFVAGLLVVVFFRALGVNAPVAMLAFCFAALALAATARGLVERKPRLSDS